MNNHTRPRLGPTTKLAIIAMVSVLGLLLILWCWHYVLFVASEDRIASIAVWTAVATGLLGLILVPLERLGLLHQRHAPREWRLTMISGVARSNDYVVGIFHDDTWARIAGEYFLQRDRLDHPEYASFTVEPA